MRYEIRAAHAAQRRLGRLIRCVRGTDLLSQGTLLRCRAKTEQRAETVQDQQAKFLQKNADFPSAKKESRKKMNYVSHVDLAL